MRTCAIFLGGLFLAMLPAYAEDNADSRQVLPLAKDERIWLLNDMRGNLATVSALVGAIATGNRDEAEKLANEHGRAYVARVPQSIKAKADQTWRSLAGSMHGSFDELAKGLGEGETTSQSLARLEKVMQNCVACHATYRVSEPK